MKTSIRAIAFAMMTIGAATAASASDSGHNGDEARSVSCKVSKLGVQQEFKELVRDTGTGSVITGQGEGFLFTVTLADAVAVLRLENTASGDKVTVEEGDLDTNETVRVTLETDEAPTEAITLSCTGN